MTYGPDDTHTAFPSMAIEAMGWGASGPVQSLVMRQFFYAAVPVGFIATHLQIGGPFSRLPTSPMPSLGK